MPFPPRQILAFEEHGSHLYLLMKRYQKHGECEEQPSWWRKPLMGDELELLGGTAEKWLAQGVAPKISIVDN